LQWGGITLMVPVGTGIPGTAFGVVSEGGSMHLQAPAGAYFTKVTFASYGNPSGTVGSYVQGSCHAASSDSIVKALVIGNNDVTIPASNDLFGEPCDGTAKRLAIQAEYEYGNITDYLWSTGATTNAITVAPSANTTYTVAVTDANGCKNNVSKTIHARHTVTSTTYVQVCENQLPYIWNYFSLFASERAEARFASSSGCDSIAVLYLTVLAGNTLYVDSSVASSGNGSNWPSAYKTFQEALGTAQASTCINTILVAKGTYYATGDGFTLQNGLAIYGGFDLPMELTT
jgi:hypothetical protein